MTPQDPETSPPDFTKEDWLIALCAWNNVPCDNEAMRKYADEKWSPASVEAWKRVALALQSPPAEKVDVEGFRKPIKRPKRDREETTAMIDKNIYAFGWNDCLDYIAANYDIVEKRGPNGR